MAAKAAKAEKNIRQAGVLLHISSLPSGDLGNDAFRFVDFLADCGVSVWQTLPINMPHADNSPYQCLSAHAGNPQFISLGGVANYTLGEVEKINRDALFKLGYQQLINSQEASAFSAFCLAHQHWLDDFALYILLRQQFNLAGWFSWPDCYKNREPSALKAFSNEHADALVQVKFEQYLFFKQWHLLKTYAHSKKVQLFGDIPIFVAYDSADVWAQPHLFKLDAQQKMTVVAGVPPDYFSETGQRWGNPHYHWDAMTKEGYKWWIARLQTQSELFDLVRIDHFRGLQAAWEIPSDEDTAINGAWALAPGDQLLAAIFKHLPQIKLIAEDLGIITPEVDALRLKYQLPGMKILQFAFGGDDTNPYLPEHIEVNSVVYTGTHDNDTTLGWYQHADANVMAHLQRYLNQTTPDMPNALIKLAMDTRAYLAIIPMQDVLSLDSSCRMNTPGTIVNNWAWQYNWAQITAQHKAFLKQAIFQSGRAVG